MTIHFVEPPPEQRTGGLDAALRSLEAALRQRGHAVSTNSASTATPGDVAHFHGLWQPAHARLSAALSKRGIATLISPHGMLEPWAWRHKRWKKWPYFWLVERRHLQRAARIVATAASEARNLSARLPRARIVTLPLGFTGEARPDYHAARQQLGWPVNEKVLLFLSRVHEKKGLDLLLHALSWQPSIEGLRLVIVGGGEPGYLESLHRLADSLGTRLPRIDWIGEVWSDARWPYFQGADLFCLPTHSENFGLAVLEACQVGTLALTTTTTPWADWLAPDRGLIVEPTIESVADGLRRFLTGANPRPTRDELAAWTEDHFSWSTLAPQYEALYREVADRGSHAG